MASPARGRELAFKPRTTTILFIRRRLCSLPGRIRIAKKPWQGLSPIFQQAYSELRLVLPSKTPASSAVLDAAGAKRFVHLSVRIDNRTLN